MLDPLKVLWVLTNSTYLVSKFLKSGNTEGDDAPYFEKSVYQVEVKEDEPLHRPFATISASTQNKESNFKYEIVGGNPGGVFEVDENSGALFLNNTVDYETRKQYTLRLSVNDVSFTNVEVTVVDVNDHPPVFEKPIYSTTILEEDNVSQPKKVLQVNVTDGDKDRPRDIIYSLTGPGVDTDDPSNGKFFINKLSGEVYVLKPLDRDLPHGRPQWKFTVFAQDEGGDGLVGYADILVNLKDVNDNSPIFPQPLCTANITENGTAGMVVLTMTAIDNDDPLEDKNAQLTYNIEKNVLDEETGTPIFSIDPTSGLIKTNICCLDREKTPDYSLQVVAVDGGGLKGTGTVSIFVSDINDMPPSFTKPEWETGVVESVNGSIPEHAVLTVNVVDQDERNDFFYKVVEGSGVGTELFTMVRNQDGTGSLKIVKPLDYEDPLQRPGFRFKIQVNDQGPNGTEDVAHVAYSWVVLHLRDLNDNDPVFQKTSSTVSLKEDVPLGTLVDTMSARDPDQGGEGKVIYRIDRRSDKRRQFVISDKGEVSVRRSLDREACAVHKLTITAEDDDEPARTSTATLTLSLEDVNDHAPTLTTPSSRIVWENSAPGVTLELKAEDEDDHRLGNGPPYTFSLDGEGNSTLTELFSVHTDPRGDEGRGIGVVKTLVTFDREEQKEYFLPILIQDSGDPMMVGTSTLTVVIGDTNDNVMRDGSAEILVHKQSGSADMYIGPVYVTDPDDWGAPDKTYFWDSTPSAHFLLDPLSGALRMSGETPKGRHTMRFRVRDSRYPQITVSSNMTVRVLEIFKEDIDHLCVLSIQGISDVDFIKSSNSVPSKMDVLRSVISELIGSAKNDVQIVSVQMQSAQRSLTQVRFFVKQGSQYFKPVKLHGLLLMNRNKIEQALTTPVHSIGLSSCSHTALCEDEAGCSETLTVSSLSHVVNANTTVLTGPGFTHDVTCICRSRDYSMPDTCANHPCLNGGTCLESGSGHRCSCPEDYQGPRCQMTSRGFQGSGWAWFPGLSICSEVHLSLEFLTNKSNGTLLYQGPVAPIGNNPTHSSDFLSLELLDGRPRLLVDFGSGTIDLETPLRLDDGRWHRIDVLWDPEEVRLVVDLCHSHNMTSVHDSSVTGEDLSHCISKTSTPQFRSQLRVNTPLQVGGWQQDPGYDWTESPSGVGLDGCVRNIFYNGEMLDLASPAWSKGSTPGCSHCGISCSSRSSCPPGFSGSSCSTKTVPSTFLPGGWVKFSLNFEPHPFYTSIQMRFRTREHQAELFRIADQYLREYIVIEIRQKNIQVRMNLNGLRPKEEIVSISLVPVNDGVWHFVKVSRHGSVAVLQLDGGEGRNYNESFRFQGHQLMIIDKQEGVFAGGPAQPSLRTGEAIASFAHGCLDDIRVDGHPLPLPPGVNSSQWGQAPASQGVERHCHSRNVCDLVKCPQNLTCQDNWNAYSCTCRSGRLPGPEGRCEILDSCGGSPCLHGGLCLPGSLVTPGYRCQCPLGSWGPRCELLQEKQSLRLGLTALLTIVGCILLIVFLVALFVAHQRRREGEGGVSSMQKTSVESDVRENIISYEDEGGGENDLNSFDLLRLKVDQDNGRKLQVPELIEETSLEGMVENRRRRLDLELAAPPYDDLRNYAFEGDYASCPGSLSSLSSDLEEATPTRMLDPNSGGVRMVLPSNYIPNPDFTLQITQV